MTEEPIIACGATAPDELIRSFKLVLFFDGNPVVLFVLVAVLFAEAPEIVALLDGVPVGVAVASVQPLTSYTYVVPFCTVVLVDVAAGALELTVVFVALSAADDTEEEETGVVVTVDLVLEVDEALVVVDEAATEVVLEATAEEEEEEDEEPAGARSAV